MYHYITPSVVYTAKSRQQFARQHISCTQHQSDIPTLCHLVTNKHVVLGMASHICTLLIWGSVSTYPNRALCTVWCLYFHIYIHVCARMFHTTCYGFACTYCTSLVQWIFRQGIIYCFCVGDNLFVK